MNDTIDRELNKMLVETFNEINGIEEKQLKKIGEGKLSISEFHLLSCIAEGGGGERTVGEIAEALGVTLPTVTVAVKRLENKGFLKRGKNVNDGRSILISLTEEGAKMNRLHSFFHEQMIFAIRREFSEEEITLLYRLIVKLNEFFSEKFALPQRRALNREVIK